VSDFKQTVFNEIIKFILDHETVFQKGHHGDYNYAISEKDPDDPGGLTKYGIDQRSHPYINIEKITLEQAKDIYYSDYYVKNKIPSMPREIQLVCLDASVNTGGRQMALWLQRALNVVDDGLIGNITLGKLHTANIQTIGTFMLDERVDFYAELANKRNNKKFLKGWLQRVADLREVFDNQFKGV